MSYDRSPDQITAPMTPTQASTLTKFTIEAYQEKLFDPELSIAETAHRIDALKREIALANSF